MSRNVIRSIRKGSVQWNEEDRLKVATLLLKAGYSVRIGRIVTDAGSKSSGRTKTEYVIEYWEEKRIMLIEKNLKEAFADYIKGKFKYRR